MGNFTSVRLDKTRYATLMVASLSVALVIFQFSSIPRHVPASAHFFSIPYLENKTVGNYKIVFQPFPTVPLVGSNSTQINLSILDKENQNVNLVFTSLLIKEKESGKIVKTFPYEFHDFSDMTFPYTFEKTGTYVITLQSKINGDPIYSDRPLTVDFDLPVVSATNAIPFGHLILYYIVPGSLAIGAIATYLRIKNKI